MLSRCTLFLAATPSKGPRCLLRIAKDSMKDVFFLSHAEHDGHLGVAYCEATTRQQVIAHAQSQISGPVRWIMKNGRSIVHTEREWRSMLANARVFRMIQTPAFTPLEYGEQLT